MCPIQDNSRPDCNNKTSSQDRDVRDSYQTSSVDNIFDKAKAIDLNSLFKSYQLPIDIFNRKINCPFYSHKQGGERTPSFYFYPDTNSFYCFGCKVSGGPIEFVVAMENLSRIAAVNKLLSNFSGSVIHNSSLQSIDYFYQRQSEIISFSNQIRNFIQKHKYSAAAIIYAEQISKIYDTLMERHSINNDGLKIMIERLITKLGLFNS